MMRIGIDLGGTNIAVGIVDEHGNILYKKSTPTKADRTPDLIVDDIVNLCECICKEQGVELSSVKSIGIAVPGGVNEKTGEIIFTPNIPFSGLNITNILSQRFDDKRVGVINDANAALLAELSAGAGMGVQDVVMITIGTGIGGGISIGGNIISGTNGMAGELGHMVIEKNGQKCSCGRRGCFEAYASATALSNLTRREIEKCQRTGEFTVMANADKINARVPFDAYKQGDVAAKRIIDEYIESLACGIISLINIFQPDLFIIGGGVSGQKQFLVDMLMPYIENEQYSRSIEKRTKLTTATCGNDAGIIGAAFA